MAGKRDQAKELRRGAWDEEDGQGDGTGTRGIEGSWERWEPELDFSSPELHSRESPAQPQTEARSVWTEFLGITATQI